MFVCFFRILLRLCVTLNTSGQAREQHNTQALRHLSGHWVYIRWQSLCWIFQWRCLATRNNNSWNENTIRKKRTICHCVVLELAVCQQTQEVFLLVEYCAHHCLSSPFHFTLNKLEDGRYICNVLWRFPRFGHNVGVRMLYWVQICLRFITNHFIRVLNIHQSEKKITK